MYYVLAYLDISATDRRFIDAFRERHDLPYKDVVAPHFTLVFGLTSCPEPELLAHVEEVCQRSDGIDFDCRYAMLGADHASDIAHVFLVPDQGYGAISRLHDALYTGPLAGNLRLDIPFIPHITIGTLEDRVEAKRLCDGLNARPVSIRGRIDAVSVVRLQEGRIHDIATVDLG